MRHLAFLAPTMAACALGGCASHAPHTLSPASLGGPAQPGCASADRTRPSARPADEGCVNAANLAAMVADPRDLLRGRPLGPSSGALQSLAVEAYLRGPVAPKTGGGAAPTVVISGAAGSGPE